MPRKPVSAPTPKTRTVSVAKGLTRAQALAAAIKKRPGDARGFTYDPKTGKARLR